MAMDHSHLAFSEQANGIQTESFPKDDKNKICKHAKIDRHLEFATADFFMCNRHTEIGLHI